MSNFFKLLSIRLIINIGDSLFYILTIWKAAELYNSNWVIGVIISLFTLPELLLFFLGPVIDRINPRTILYTSLLTQVFSVLIILLFSANISIYLFLPVVFISAFASAISYPLEDVLIPQIVEKNKVVFANTVFSISYKVLDSIFNGFTGILISLFSFYLLYSINLFVFLLAFIPLFFFKFTYKKTNNERFNFDGYKKDLIEGGNYIFSHKLILALSIPLIFMNLLNSINAVAFVNFSQLFTNPTQMFGFITGVSGIGGLIGTVSANYLVKKYSVGHLLTLTLILSGFFWIVATYLNQPAMTILFFGLSYFCTGIYNLILGSLYQLIPPITILGRANTFVDSLISAAMPIGGIVAPIILNRVSPNLTLSIYGIVSILVGAIFIKNKLIFKLPIIEKISRDT